MCCASKYEFGQHFVTQHMEIERLKSMKLIQNELASDTLSTSYTKNSRRGVGYRSTFPSQNAIGYYSNPKKANGLKSAYEPSYRNMNNVTCKIAKGKFTYSGMREYFTCPVCNANLMTKDSLKKHMHVQHEGGREKWICHLCDSKLGSKDSMKRHYHHVHNIERNLINIEDGHRCRVCRGLLPTLAALVEHEKVKHQQAIDPKLEKIALANKSPGNASIKSVGKVLPPKKPKEKKWVCEVCNSRLSNWDSLKKHRKNLHGLPAPTRDDIRICNICSGQLCHRQALDMHVQNYHK